MGGHARSYPIAEASKQIKEQTYLELVSDASAARTLQQLRVILQDKTLTKTEALAEQKRVLAHCYIKQEVKRERGGDAFSSVKRARAGSMEHVRAQRQEKQRRRTCLPR